MRRGYSLVELLVALAILATLGSITLRLTFAGDRALQTNAARATADSAALRLLRDVSDDLRAASSVSSSDPIAMQRPEGRVTYAPLPGGDGVRRLAGDVIEDYPGVKLAVSAGGRLHTVTVRGQALTLRTAVCRRRAGP